MDEIFMNYDNDGCCYFDMNNICILMNCMEECIMKYKNIKKNMTTFQIINKQAKEKYLPKNIVELISSYAYKNVNNDYETYNFIKTEYLDYISKNFNLNMGLTLCKLYSSNHSNEKIHKLAVKEKKLCLSNIKRWIRIYNKSKKRITKQKYYKYIINYMIYYGFLTKFVLLNF